MKPETTEDRARPLTPARRALSGGAASAAGRFAACVVILGACFGKPLFEVARYAAVTELFSHIPLIPLVTAYLIWLQRRELAGIDARPSKWAVLPLLLGLTTLGSYWLLRQRGWRPVLEDQLSLEMLAFYWFLLAAGFFFLGNKLMRALAFPLGFLIFIVPFPVVVVDALEVFFQHTSADATNVMLALTGMPFVRDGLVFQLPGITIQVGQECSGIRSSLVLFITSLLAGHLFLRTPWKKAFLAVFVVPLGILRNGFRIATIAMLCVHVDPNMINSPIHRKGGPLFFVLSLAPFFLVLFYLRKSEVGGNCAQSDKEET